MGLAPAVLIAASPGTGEIRPFVERDIPQVTRLHRTVFQPAGRTARAAREPYYAYFTRVFLHNPSRTATLPSLVYQEHDGRIVGFLGVVPRRMVMKGQRFQAAISSQFIVDRSSRAGLVATRLAKAFLEGPQDVSIADEATDVTRRIWEGLGGTTSVLHSMHWTRPLRPAGFVLSMTRQRRRLASLAVLARPLAAVADELVMRIPQSPFYRSAPPHAAEELSEATVLAHVSELAAGLLRPEYDGRTLHWLFERARQRKPAGRLCATVVRRGHKVAGWYVYHLNVDRLADVLQIAATAASIHEVLEHLFREAAWHGAVAVSGRLDPRFLQALSDSHCLFHRRGPWVLIKGANPELVRFFQDDHALFSRLDGEWCLGY